LLSPAIVQRTGVNKSVSFARWQQGAGFVVPRTTACYYVKLTENELQSVRSQHGAPSPQTSDSHLYQYADKNNPR